MVEFARYVGVLKEHPRNVLGTVFAPPPASWAAAVDVAASLMEPHWDRFWGKPTDSDALAALAIITYAIGGGEQASADAVRDLFAGPDIHSQPLRLAEPCLVDAVSTALRAAGHNQADAHDPVAAAWEYLTRDRTQESMAAPEFLRETAVPEMFGDPGPESLLFRAMPTMARAAAA